MRIVSFLFFLLFLAVENSFVGLVDRAEFAIAIGAVTAVHFAPAVTAEEYFEYLKFGFVHVGLLNTHRTHVRTRGCCDSFARFVPLP